MPAAQQAAVFREGRDDPVGGLVRGAFVVLVGDVQVLTADEADAQHDLGHGSAA